MYLIMIVWYPTGIALAILVDIRETKYYCACYQQY
jgi:hypothetical protein